MNQTRYDILFECSPEGPLHVFLAHDFVLDRDVEMKISPADTLDSQPDQQSAMLHEPRVLRLLDHPAIPPIFDLGRHQDGSRYYTMPPARGQTVTDRIQSASSLSERLKLLPAFMTMCHAVAYAHSRGIVHRALHPDHVFTGEHGAVLLRRWQYAAILNQPETIPPLPSPNNDRDSEYLPPECRHGRINTATPSMDIFGLGTMLQFIFTGHHSGSPFLDALPRPYQGMSAICQRAMAGNPAERHESVEEFIHALTPFIAKTQVLSRQTVPATLRTRRARKRKAQLRAAAIALVLAAGATLAGVTLYQWDARRTEEARRALEQLQRVDSSIAQAVDSGPRSNPSQPPEVEHWAYWSGIVSAAAHIENGTIDQARRELADVPESLRNWEWGHYQRLLNLDRLTINAEMAPIFQIAFGPNALRLYTAGRNPMVRAWDAHVGRPITSYDGFTGEVRTVACTPDGRHILATSPSTGAIVWDAESGTIITRFDEHDGPIWCAAISPDGRIAATAGQDQIIRLWELETGVQVQTLEGHNSRVRSLTFTPDGRHLISGGWNGLILFWILDPELQDYALSGESGAITALTCHPDGSVFAAATTSGRLHVYDLATGRQRRAIDAHDEPILHAQYSPDGTLLATASRDRTIKLWDSTTARHLSTIIGHSDEVVSLAFSPDGSQIASGDSNGQIKVWNVTDWHAPGDPPLKSPLLNTVTIPAETRRFDSAVLSSDARYAAISSRSTVTIWDRVSMQSVAEFDVEARRVSALAFSPRNDAIVIGTSNSVLTVRSIDTGEELLTVKGQTTSPLNFQQRPVRAVAVSADLQYAAMGDDSGAVEIWDIQTQLRPYRFPAQGGWVTTLAFHPYEAQIVTAGRDGVARIWREEEEGGLVHVLQGHTDRITRAGHSPGGSFLLTASADHTARLWDLRNGNLAATFHGHRSIVTKPVFTPDGQRVITSGNDHTIRVWHIPTQRELVRLSSMSHLPSDIAVTSDGLTIVAVSLDKTLLEWTADPWRGGAERAVTSGKPPQNASNFLAR